MTLATPEARSEGQVLDLVDRLRASRLPPPSEWRAIRVASGASLRDVAKAVGVDTMTISRWERGHSQPWPRHAQVYRIVLDALARLGCEREKQRGLVAAIPERPSRLTDPSSVDVQK